MRGKLLEGHERLHHVRIIPAHAGQTRRWHSDADSQSDHPRACGANAAIFCTVDGICGSSPRMRGKHVRNVETAVKVRIIPAHAGQTERLSWRVNPRPDHPRACGANLPMRRPWSRLNGSSPRMRGKLSHRPRLACPVRIIPAHAGQTQPPSIIASPATDHPRACGANRSVHLSRRADDGSSPRMRGKPGRCQGRVCTGRIIPAHAGQTRALSRTCLYWTDHPRACGANRWRQWIKKQSAGSSPRMRGKQVRYGGVALDIRIIPAHAGQTGQCRQDIDRTADHPRACGANSPMIRIASTADGSSPRMRGKLPGTGHRDIARPHRIIPAHAGQTASSSVTCRALPDHPRACGANAL